MSGSRPWRSLALLAVAAGLVLALVAALVNADFRRVRGPLRSAGAGWDNWSAAPTSCALDPQDGRPPGESSTRVSLLWLDSEAADHARFLNWAGTPDTPRRLDLIVWPPAGSSGQPASGAALMGVLRTVKHNGPLLLDAGVCSKLELSTWPEPPLVREGRAALGGVLTLDCTTAGRHLSGRIQFDRCGF